MRPDPHGFALAKALEPPASIAVVPGESLLGRLACAPARPLRVAVVTGSYNYIKDGVALTLNRLVAYLEAQGAEALVFAPVAKEPAFTHAGTLVEIPSIPLLTRPEYRVALGLPAAARRRLEAFRPDIVHIAVPDILGYAALRFARRRGLTAVASYHSRYDTYLQHYGAGLLQSGLQKYLRHFFGACREVYVPSASMIEELRAQGMRDNLRLWSRGVDTVRFHPAKRSQEWRARYGVGENDVLIAFVSRLVREKELGTLAAVFNALKRARVPHRSLIVGDGPERSWVAQHCPDSILAGFLDGEELACAYASADVFFFPSDTETFGNVTLEAMASGLPTVCADATGSRSLVAPGVTGHLVAPRQVDGFAEKLAALIADADLRRRMGGAARERSLQFSWEREMARLLGYYRALAPDPREAPSG